MAKILITTVDDFSDIHDKLDDMSDRADNFQPIFKKMRRDLEDAWTDNFAKLGSATGGWAPLDAQYGAWKSVHFPGRPPMIRSGKLFKSLGNLRGAPNEIRDGYAVFGTNVEYAKFHQYGTTKMSKRPVVFEPFDFARKWSEETANYIERG